MDAGYEKAYRRARRGIVASTDAPGKASVPAPTSTLHRFDGEAIEVEAPAPAASASADADTSSHHHHHHPFPHNHYTSLVGKTSPDASFSFVGGRGAMAATVPGADGWLAQRVASMGEELRMLFLRMPASHVLGQMARDEASARHITQLVEGGICDALRSGQEAAIGTLKEENEALAAALRSREDAVASLQAANSDLRAECADAKGAAALLQETAAQAEAQVKRLSRDGRRSRRALRAGARAVEDARAGLDRLTEAVEAAAASAPRHPAADRLPLLTREVRQGLSAAFAGGVGVDSDDDDDFVGSGDGGGVCSGSDSSAGGGRRRRQRRLRRGGGDVTVGGEDDALVRSYTASCERALMLERDAALQGREKAALLRLVDSFEEALGGTAAVFAPVLSQGDARGGGPAHSTYATLDSIGSLLTAVLGASAELIKAKSEHVFRHAAAEAAAAAVRHSAVLSFASSGGGGGGFASRATDRSAEEGVARMQADVSAAVGRLKDTHRAMKRAVKARSGGGGGGGGGNASSHSHGDAAAGDASVVTRDALMLSQVSSAAAAAAATAQQQQALADEVAELRRESRIRDAVDDRLSRLGLTAVAGTTQASQLLSTSATGHGHGSGVASSLATAAAVAAGAAAASEASEPHHITKAAHLRDMHDLETRLLDEAQGYVRHKEEAAAAEHERRTARFEQERAALRAAAEEQRNLRETDAREAAAVAGRLQFAARAAEEAGRRASVAESAVGVLKGEVARLSDALEKATASGDDVSAALESEAEARRALQATAADALAEVSAAARGASLAFDARFLRGFEEAVTMLQRKLGRRRGGGGAAASDLGPDFHQAWCLVRELSASAPAAPPRRADSADGLRAAAAEESALLAARGAAAARAVDAAVGGLAAHAAEGGFYVPRAAAGALAAALRAAAALRGECAGLRGLAGELRAATFGAAPACNDAISAAAALELAAGRDRAAAEAAEEKTRVLLAVVGEAVGAGGGEGDAASPPPLLAGGVAAFRAAAASFVEAPVRALRRAREEEGRAWEVRLGAAEDALAETTRQAEGLLEANEVLRKQKEQMVSDVEAWREGKEAELRGAADAAERSGAEAARALADAAALEGRLRETQASQKRMKQRHSEAALKYHAEIDETREGLSARVAQLEAEKTVLEADAAAVRRDRAAVLAALEEERAEYHARTEAGNLEHKATLERLHSESRLNEQYIADMAEKDKEVARTSLQLLHLTSSTATG